MEDPHGRAYIPISADPKRRFALVSDEYGTMAERVRVVGPTPGSLGAWLARQAMAGRAAIDGPYSIVDTWRPEAMRLVPCAENDDEETA